MTDVGGMSVGELVGKVRADEHAEVLRPAGCWLAQELMEAEVSQQAGAGSPAMASVTRSGWRGATAPASGPGTPGPGVGAAELVSRRYLSEASTAELAADPTSTGKELQAA